MLASAEAGGAGVCAPARPRVAAAEAGGGEEGPAGRGAGGRRSPREAPRRGRRALAEAVGGSWGSLGEEKPGGGGRESGQ